MNSEDRLRAQRCYGKSITPFPSGAKLVILDFELRDRVTLSPCTKVPLVIILDHGRSQVFDSVITTLTPGVETEKLQPKQKRLY